MMVARVLIKSSLQSGKSPAEAVESVNNQLCEGNDAEFFVTAWVAVLEISTGNGIAVNAGHEHPVLRRAGSSYKLLVYKHSIPLATIKGIPFKQHEFKLNPGDSFFVYTDGVVEATDEKKELYGSNRMLDALNKEPDALPEQVLANVSHDINRFVDGAEQFDDITMLCFRYAGPSEDDT
jgi:sigma-B regulation protein RsbU (phosphoserine phosphatase)